MLDGILKEAIVAYVESESKEGPTYITSTFSHDSLSPGLDTMPGFSEGQQKLCNLDRTFHCG